MDQSGNILVDNQYGQGNRITSSIQYDAASQTYKKVTYSFRADGSLLKESYSLPVATYDAAKQAAVENLFNFYRDASGQLFSFEYKGQVYDYVYNQRGDVVAITEIFAEHRFYIA